MGTALLGIGLESTGLGDWEVLSFARKLVWS